MEQPVQSAARGRGAGRDAGAPLTWCAQVLQGGANIEQARDLSSADLAWFTGVPVASAQVQRQTLDRLLLRDRPLWLELLRGNALLLADGPGRGDGVLLRSAYQGVRRRTALSEGLVRPTARGCEGPAPGLLPHAQRASLLRLPRRVKSQSEALEERLRTVSHEDSKLRFLAAEGCRRPDTAAKHLMDCTKIIARNVFYCLLRDFRRHYDNRRDDLPILRLVTRAAGTLHVRDGVLHAGLWLRAGLEPGVRAAIGAFLADVSGQINVHFAGWAVPVHISLLRAAPEL